MSKGIYFRIDESLLEKLDEVAKSMGLSRSEAIRLAIENFIEFYNSEFYS